VTALAKARASKRAPEQRRRFTGVLMASGMRTSMGARLIRKKV
jgi:hypothetical protein